MKISFDILLIVMAAIAVVVYIFLHKIDAGYGKFYTKKWGKSISNKLGWKIMEAPVFFLMIAFWLFSPYKYDIVRIVFLVLFELHYFHRAFIFPEKFRSTSQMAISVVIMGVVFQLINALMQGGWIFYISKADYYSISWFYSPQFIIGVILFFVGMIINIKSDNIIFNLRTKGDHNYYLPQKGLYKYVTSANYFGELIEWIGFAVLTWSWAGLIFVIWTFANLAPRAKKIYDKYTELFPDEMKSRKVKKIIPFIY